MVEQPTIPPLLKRVRQRIEMQMSDEARSTFPKRFADTIPADADLTLAPWKLLHRVASDMIASHADASTATLCSPALDVCRRWSQGENVSVEEATDTLRGVGEYTSEDQVDEDPVRYNCEVVARCTNPHHEATWHTMDVALAMIASMQGEGVARTAAFDAFGEILLECVEAA